MLLRAGEFGNPEGEVQMIGKHITNGSLILSLMIIQDNHFAGGIG